MRLLGYHLFLGTATCKKKEDMKKSTQLILSVVLCLLLAAGGYFWATGMISSNYDYRSPLDQHTPAKGQALGSAATSPITMMAGLAS